jgi:hypothetical protein
MDPEISPLPDSLATLTEAEFGTGSRAAYLLQISVQEQDYNKDTVFKLLAACRGRR